jgi:hypothetical protein
MREFHRAIENAPHGAARRARPGGASRGIVPNVFHRNGKRIRNLPTAWVSACTEAGSPAGWCMTFRRTAVRNLERNGVSRAAAMAMVGQKTESIYRRYAIVDAGALRDAAAKIDQASADSAQLGGAQLG